MTALLYEHGRIPDEFLVAGNTKSGLDPNSTERQTSGSQPPSQYVRANHAVSTSGLVLNEEPLRRRLRSTIRLALDGRLRASG